MDLNYTTQQLEFRDQIRDFLAKKLPAYLAKKGLLAETLTKEDMQTWHAILNEQGWLAATWPSEFGGPGWSVVERHIFEEECVRSNAPRIVPFGLRMLGPVLIEFGSAQQQATYLPRILSGEDWWCQGYSEPGAGSDLASLRTRADRDGDHYIVNGQKTWTTFAQFANKIFCLVRTSHDVKPQAGISFLLMDLEADGIEVRPIRLLNGEHEVNEVFFTNVRVPTSNLVGAENQGWTIAKYLLGHERTNLAAVGFSQRDLSKLVRLTKSINRSGRPLEDNEIFAHKIAELETDLEALKITNLRMLSAAEEGKAPGAVASMLKIKGTQIRQDISALYRSALGPEAAIFHAAPIRDGELSIPAEAANAASVYFDQRKLTIYGGSSEIQRNIIARDIFGD